MILKVRAKCFFGLSKLYCSLSVCCVPQDVMSFDSQCRMFDPQAPAEEPRASGFDSDSTGEPEGPSISRRSQTWAQHFLLPTLDLTVPRPLQADKHNAQGCVCAVSEEQECFTALPVWPQVILTKSDKAREPSPCCLASYELFQKKWRFDYCDMFVRVYWW